MVKEKEEIDTNLVGKNVVVLCSNYIYEGKLLRETHDSVFLTGTSDEHGPRIIYATGPWADAKRGRDGEVKWRNAEYLPVRFQRLERSAVESIGPLVI